VQPADHHRVRSATAPASSATVMMANMSWKDACANTGIRCPAGPVSDVASPYPKASE
jgi:hypothetical protein